MIEQKPVVGEVRAVRAVNAIDKAMARAADAEDMALVVALRVARAHGGRFPSPVPVSAFLPAAARDSRPSFRARADDDVDEW